MMRIIVTAAATLGVAVAISGCSPEKKGPRTDRSPSPQPSSITHGPPNAILEPSGLISKLPDTCQAVKTSLPSEMLNSFLFNGSPSTRPDARECVWTAVNDTSARVFRYILRRSGSDAQAHDAVESLKHSTTFADFDCRYKTANVEKVTDIGKDAFAAPCTYKKYDNLDSESDHVYEVRGGTLVFRTRNAAIQVWWVRADYPTSETLKAPHWLRGGSQLAYKQALPQMIQVAKAILTHFPQ